MSHYNNILIFLFCLDHRYVLVPYVCILLGSKHCFMLFFSCFFSFLSFAPQLYPIPVFSFYLRFRLLCSKQALSRKYRVLKKETEVQAKGREDKKQIHFLFWRNRKRSTCWCLTIKWYFDMDCWIDHK